jgi:pathogenesis-related protein 1
MNYWSVYNESCSDISHFTQIPLDSLLSFNPGLNCSNLVAGDHLCIEKQSSFSKRDRDYGALNTHNDERRSVGVQHLDWDDHLAGQAYDYSKHLLYASSDCQLIHSDYRNQQYGSKKGEGENLHVLRSWYPIKNEELKMSNAVKRWISEKWTGQQGKKHYTQVVWSRTKKVGCSGVYGRSKNNMFCHFVTCRYFPPGNIIGQSPY